MALIIRDNIFQKREADFLQQEVKDRIPYLKQWFYDESMIYRLSLDDYYKQNRANSPALQFIPKVFNNELKDEIQKIEDYAFHRMSLKYEFDTFLTQFREEDILYRWHKDSTEAEPRIFMSWIYYVNDDFEGGILHYKKDGEEIPVTPKKNRIVLLPANIPHMISPIKYNEGQNIRTTLNGFMYM